MGGYWGGGRGTPEIRMFYTVTPASKYRGEARRKENQIHRSSGDLTVADCSRRHMFSLTVERNSGSKQESSTTCVRNGKTGEIPERLWGGKQV